MMKSQTVKHGTVLQRIKRHRESYLLMLPYLLFFTVFTLAPVVVAFVLSFTEYNMLQPPRFVFMANYIRMFLEDNVFLTAVSNTHSSRPGSPAARRPTSTAPPACADRGWTSWTR